MQYYQSRDSSQFQALGPDLFNGSVAQLTSFGTTIGATFPLLLDGSLGSGDEDLYLPYGDRETYAVINKQGILRYNAFLIWPYGSRYHENELRACIDTLVSSNLGVGDGAPAAFRLDVAPNPVRGTTTIELTNPRAVAGASIVVLDLAGRELARVWSGPAAQGVTRVSWNGRATSGARVPPGIYLVDSSVGGVHLTRRVAVVR